MSSRKMREVICDGIKDRAGKVPDKNRYHFKEGKDNLVVPMSEKICKYFADGSGQEFRKMQAVYSSSAMTFNIFGNGPVKIGRKGALPAGEYLLQYEKKLPVLKKGGAANIDVCLTKEDTVIFFEMKMIEWLFWQKRGLSQAYWDEARYYQKEIFPAVKAVAEVIKKKPASKAGDYHCKYKHFDAFQILKHIIGIYNGVVNSEEFVGVKKIKLVAGYWTVPEDIRHKMPDDVRTEYDNAAQDMKDELEDFQGRISALVECFTSHKIRFEFDYLTVEEIFHCLKNGDDLTKKRYCNS